jgi:prolyl 4-hydroxylase
MTEEADHIIKLAAPQLSRSDVVDTDTGKEVESKVRTSKGTFLSRGQDKVIKDIEDRIARWTLLPVGNGEGLQVLRYENGQHYDG